jgi:hypothetical protein
MGHGGTIFGKGALTSSIAAEDEVTRRNEMDG